MITLALLSFLINQAVIVQKRNEEVKLKYKQAVDKLIDNIITIVKLTTSPYDGTFKN